MELSEDGGWVDTETGESASRLSILRTLSSLTGALIVAFMRPCDRLYDIFGLFSPKNTWISLSRARVLVYQRRDFNEGCQARPGVGEVNKNYFTNDCLNRMIPEI